MKFVFFTCIILLSLNSLLAEIQTIDNIHTYKHVLIPGTNISMIPPDDFEISKNFKGFQHKNDKMSMIMILEIPAPFTEIANVFQPELLKEQKMTLISSKKIIINGINGLIVEYNQIASGFIFSKYAFLYGDDKQVTLINGMCLIDSLEVIEIIKKSINSTVINKDLSINPRLALDYQIDETVGGFVFENVMGNAMMFNKSNPQDSSLSISFMVDKSFQKVDIADKKSFCIERLKQLPAPFKINESKGLKEITIDGISGFELFANNTNKPEDEMYQVILFDDDGGYFIFIAFYNSDNHQEINNIREVMKTFKQKK